MNKKTLIKNKVIFSLFFIFLLSLTFEKIIHQANVYCQDTKGIEIIDLSSNCPSGCYVHITKTGTKYHTAGCTYLSESDIRVCRDDVIKAGYTPCSKCGGKCDPIR